MEYWNMEERRERSRNIQGRADFVGGIDNEALDFSQLEAFINSEGTQGGASYFSDGLAVAAAAAAASSAPSPVVSASNKLLNVIVENKRQPGHPLPDSPPDSGSEHPYSPSESCEPPVGSQEAIYTTLGQPTQLYKPGLLNPMLNESLLLSHPIVISAQHIGSQTQEGLLQTDQQSSIILQDGGQEANLMAGDGRIIIQDANSKSSPGYNEPNPQTMGHRQDMEYEKSHLVHIGYNTGMEIPQMQRAAPVPNVENVESGIQAVYTNLQSAPKKRKLSQDAPLVKSEPEICPPGQLSPPSQIGQNVDDDYAASEGPCLSDSQYQCIRFSPFQQSAWHVLCDQNLAELPVPHYRVDADKGFNFSNADDAFVCQKKNHFQITCHVQLIGDAQFVKTVEGLQKITNFHLHFYGVKHDCPTQTIRVEQSQSDRSKKPFHPVLVELVNSQVTKVTVGRLHFSETTSNNMRKKGKPNPEQRYFQLVVGLHAHTAHGHFPIASHASQRIIVRASNPGQFESDVDLCWQKGQTQESVFHAGKVGINTDRPDESLVVHGNLKITGHIIQPSDLRAKKNIVECDTAEQLRNVQRLRVVRYEYAPGFAAQLHRDGEKTDTGVIAQEVAQVLPEAVSPAGNLILENGSAIHNFLVVNKERIFMENIGAVKELCKVTDNLETRIDQLERINRRLTKLKRGDSLKSNSTISSSKLAHSLKCPKGHQTCTSDPELCSNKFIQIVIIILVLIMAFCLAAITTLYLLESTRHSHPRYRAEMPIVSTVRYKRPTKSSKISPWPNMQNIHHSTPKEKDTIAVDKPPMDSAPPPNKLPPIIGRPPECHGDFEIDMPQCQSHCCPPESILSPDMEGPPFDKPQRPTMNMNRSDSEYLKAERNEIKPFNSNNIDKQRQKRDSGSWKEQDNDITMDQRYFITVKGKTFNATLNLEYCVECENNSFNYTYVVPISKYVSDDHVSLIFTPSLNNMYELNHCHTGHLPLDCSDINVRRLNEDIPKKQAHSIIFLVNILGVQNKIVVYRESLVSNQNACQLPSGKPGYDFIEYNFRFSRDCED